VSGYSRREFLTALAASAAATALPEATRAAKAAVIPDVLVLGAGLSGLNAATLLESMGARVLVVEARPRVGGRVFTRSDLPGHPEIGANNMTPGYARTIAAAKRLNLDLVDYAPRFMLTVGDHIGVGGQALTRTDWATSSLNSQPTGARNQFPGEFVGGLLARNNPLKSADQWVAPESAALDVPMYDVLRSLGASDEAIALGFEHNIPYGMSSHDLSALMYWFIDAWGKVQRQFGGAALAIKQGNQRLPEAMRAALRGDVVLDREVVAIREEAASVTAVCRDGSRFTAKHSVCSLPLGALADIACDPLLPPSLRKATETLQYMKVSHHYFAVNKPYWRDDGMNPSMWTDGPAGMVFGQRFGDTDDEVTILSASQRGLTAAYIDRLSPAEAADVIRRDIERLRPAAVGCLTPVGSHSWAQDPYATGGWVVFGPGQVAEFAGKLGRPRGRLHFCGEHTAVSNRGMEGAMESGERVALEVADAL